MAICHHRKGRLLKLPSSLLLLVLLLTTHCLAAVTTPLPVPPTPPSPSRRGLSPSPPTLPTSTTNLLINNIIDALIGAGDFSSWANVLSSSGPSTLPLSATLFIPGDDSLPPPAVGSVIPPIDPLIFPYHIVPQRLSFSDLSQFKLFSRLPTLLSNKSILITNTSLSNFSLDDVLISHPDIYFNSAISIHGISSLLDYSVYGDSDRRTSPPQILSPPSTTAPPAIFFPEGDTVVGDDLPGSYVGRLCAKVWGLFFLACGIFLSSNILGIRH